MLSGHWRCSRCLGQTSRTVARRQWHRPYLGLRYIQSTPFRLSNAELISPVLLERARAIASEHATLSNQNAESYDIVVAKKIGELGPVTTALQAYDDAQTALSELELMLKDPASDAEIKSLAQTDIDSTVSSIPTLVNELKTSLIPPHPFASMPCMIEIHPGAGGSEASLFAHSLLQMYMSLCTRLGFPHNLASYSPDDSAPAGTTGLTDAILEITAPNTYDLLRSEAGVHRVQRVPATEKKGRTHTSAVSVLVLPSLPSSNSESGGHHGSDSSSSAVNFDDPNSDYYIAPGDVRSETMRARGAGGQHVNKTDSAVRLTHIPTGTVVGMQDSRSQHKNREKAWAVLRSKIAQMRRDAREQEMINLRRSVMGGVARTGREDKVRTYNYSQNRVTDHRSGVESSDLDGVLAGEEALERIMQSVREWMVEGEVMGLVVEEKVKQQKRPVHHL